MQNSVFTRRLAPVAVTTLAMAMVVAPAMQAQRKSETPKQAPVQDSVPMTDSSVVPMGSAVPLPTEGPPEGTVFNAEPKPGVDTVNRIVAVVGKSAITWSELASQVYSRIAGRQAQMPRSNEAQLKLGRDVLQELINEELLIQKAPDVKGAEVSEEQIANETDRRVKMVKSQFSSDAEYRSKLKEAGLGTPEQYRQTLLEQTRREMLVQRVTYELAKTAKPGSVTEAEVDTAFERVRERFTHQPAMVTFRQIVIVPRPSPAEDSAALNKTRALLAEIRKGGDFAEIAKRESMDPGSKEQGGDLGWSRRNGTFVPEFEYAMFTLRPGQVSEPVKTAFGYHLIKVDRVQPAEVKVRHILISPKIDSTDMVRTRKMADSVAQVWRAGGNFEQLVTKFHDQAEEKTVLTPFPVDSLPSAYAPVFKDLQVNEVSRTFDLVSPNGGIKFAIVQLVTRTKEGEFSEADAREMIRQQLMREKQFGTIIERLRAQTYVSVRF